MGNKLKILFKIKYGITFLIGFFLVPIGMALSALSAQSMVLDLGMGQDYTFIIYLINLVPFFVFVGLGVFLMSYGVNGFRGRKWEIY